MAKARLLLMDEDSIMQAAKIVSSGGIIAFPTDTVYGLGCNPFDSDSARALVKTKRRVKGSLPVLVDSLETATRLADFNSIAVELAKNFWPGGLTLVVSSAMNFPPDVLSGGMVGLRMPDRSDTLHLIRECGKSLVGTSANISGMPSARTANEVLMSLGSEIDLVLDGGPSAFGKESTVVRVTGNVCSVLREGSITIESIRRVCPIVGSE